MPPKNQILSRLKSDEISSCELEDLPGDENFALPNKLQLSIPHYREYNRAHGPNADEPQNIHTLIQSDCEHELKSLQEAILITTTNVDDNQQN